MSHTSIRRRMDQFEMRERRAAEQHDDRYVVLELLADDEPVADGCPVLELEFDERG